MFVYYVKILLFKHVSKEIVRWRSTIIYTRKMSTERNDMLLKKYTIKLLLSMGVYILVQSRDYVLKEWWK